MMLMSMTIAISSLDWWWNIHRGDDDDEDRDDWWESCWWLMMQTNVDVSGIWWISSVTIYGCYLCVHVWLRVLIDLIWQFHFWGWFHTSISLFFYCLHTSISLEFFLYCCHTLNGCFSFFSYVSEECEWLRGLL